MKYLLKSIKVTLFKDKITILNLIFYDDKLKKILRERIKEERID